MKEIAKCQTGLPAADHSLRLLCAAATELANQQEFCQLYRTACVSVSKMQINREFPLSHYYKTSPCTQ